MCTPCILTYCGHWLLLLRYNNWLFIFNLWLTFSNHRVRQKRRPGAWIRKLSAHFTSRFHVVVLIPLPKRRFFVPSFRWTHLWSLYDLIVSCGKGCLLRNESKFLSVAALKWKLPVITNPVLYQLYIPCFQFIWLGHETDSQSLFGSKCKTVVISALSTRVIEVKFKKLLSKKLGAIEICHLLLVSSLHKWTD